MPPGARSCGTCAHSDIAVGEDGPVRECHLLPPVTMPEPPPPLDEDLLAEWGSEPVLVEEIDFAPHRYPVVTDRDWCSHHKETP